MTPAQKTRGIIIILVLYVVIALIGFFAVYFIKTTFFPTKPDAQAPSPVVTKTKAALPNGWKTYSDTKDHLSFAYPSTLQPKTASYQFGVSNIELRSADNTDPNNAADYQMLILPKTLASAAGQDFEGYYNVTNNTTKPVTSPLSNKKSTQNFTKLSNRTISGHRAFNYRSASQNATPNAEAEIGVFIEDGSSLILISAGESSKTELEQILQTIKLGN